MIFNYYFGNTVYCNIIVFIKKQIKIFIFLGLSCHVNILY